MKALGSDETSRNTNLATRPYIPEDLNHQIHCSITNNNCLFFATKMLYFFDRVSGVAKIVKENVEFKLTELKQAVNKDSNFTAKLYINTCTSL